jgi:hypothetical protein
MLKNGGKVEQIYETICVCRLIRKKKEKNRKLG